MRTWRETHILNTEIQNYSISRPSDQEKKAYVIKLEEYTFAWDNYPPAVTHFGPIIQKCKKPGLHYLFQMLIQ